MESTLFIKLEQDSTTSEEPLVCVKNELIEPMNLEIATDPLDVTDTMESTYLDESEKFLSKMEELVPTIKQEKPEPLDFEQSGDFQIQCNADGTKLLDVEDKTTLYIDSKILDQNGFKQEDADSESNINGGSNADVDPILNDVKLKLLVPLVRSGKLETQQSHQVQEVQIKPKQEVQESEVEGRQEIQEKLNGIPLVCVVTQRPIETDQVQRIQLCTICGDRATGKHYGAVACDGCKGFFRRCVRRNHVNACRLNRVCVVDKDQRNRCQGCRFLKCFKVGMKKEAVKNERGPVRYFMQAGLSVASLLNADLCSRRGGEASEKNYDPKLRSAATVSDLCDTMHQHLLILVKWAKLVPTFSNLPLDDQVALLHARSGDNLLLCLAQRSMYLNDVLLVTNSRVIDRYVIDNGTPNSDTLMCLGMRAMDELVRPFTELLVDDTEFACLKAIVIFDPDVAELSEHGLTRALRRNIQMNLENYVNSYRHDSPGRFGELLLRLPSLRSIASEMMERVDFIKAFGEAPANTLRELLLSSATESTKQNSQASSEVRKVPGGPITDITPNSLQGDPASSSLPTHLYPLPNI